MCCTARSGCRCCERKTINRTEKGRNHTVSTDTSVNTAFTDASSIAPWAKDAVAFCQTNKLMNGDNHGAFNPKGQIKSVELAQVLYNLSQQIK